MVNSTLPTTSDPLQLRKRLVPEDQLGSNKRIAHFYRGQNLHIERMLSGGASTENSELKNEGLMVKLAIKGSLYANVLLSGLQLYAAISSLSLSLFATMVDSIFDPLANLILNWAYTSSEDGDLTKWPVGKARFETVGSIVYAFIMGACSLVLIVESVRTLITASDSDGSLWIPSVVAVAVSFLVKFILFLICFPLKSKYPQIKALWLDHRNDLFMNALGITTSVLGKLIYWWIDPAGAIFISLFILVSWILTCKEELSSLIGKSAPPEFLQILAYKTIMFHDKVSHIDAVRAYKLGPKYTVEVDVVMDENTPLRVSHDISEALQIEIESIADVERAFVHVDYETTHAPEHRKNR